MIMHLMVQINDKFWDYPCILKVVILKKFSNFELPVYFEGDLTKEIPKF